MGCQVHAGILTEDKKLTKKAYDRFVAEVKDIVLNGSQNLKIQTPFPCGDPIPANPDMKPEDYALEDTSKFSDFHKNVVVGQYEKLAVSLDMDPTFSLLPVVADPIALAGSFGVELPPMSFPTGYLPYFTGLLVPKFAVDLASSGVTDFVPPALLIPELTKLISVPKPPLTEMPPNVSLPIPPTEIPAPPSIALQPPIPGVDVEIPPIPELPNPLKLLPEYVNVQVAMATGIPNLLLQLISKMPQLLPKLADIKSVFAEICAMVRDSGVFGNVEPTSVVQQASNVVLARKTSECLFIAALSQTVGTSPGSVASGVSRNVLEYDAQEQPEPTPRVMTPQEKVKQWANSLRNISYGSDPETYISKLFYIESALGDLPNETINIFGEPTSDYQKNNYRVSNNPNAIEIDLLNTPVEQTSGFKIVAARKAAEASSCGIFARSCYYAAGCNNLWFVSQYINETAVSGFEHIGILRNYRWVIKNEKGDDVINEDLVRLSEGITSINGWVLVSRKVEQPDGSTKYTFVPQNSLLEPHLKPFNERALIGIGELISIARGEHVDCPEFPALDVADVIMINDPTKQNTQHVLVITTPRSAGFELSLDADQHPYLKRPLQGVDGGQTDSTNKGSAVDAVKSATYKDRLLEGFREPDRKLQGLYNGDYGEKELFDISIPEIAAIAGKFYIDGDTVYQISQRNPDTKVYQGSYYVNTNWARVDVTETLKVGKPTAILACNYDIGTFKKDLTLAAGHPIGGFYIGESRMFISNGTEMKNTNLKQIAWIARGANFLNPRENETEVGLQACVYMDETPAIKYGILKYNEKDGKPTADSVTISLCFPSITMNQGFKRKKEKDAAAAGAKNKVRF